MSVVALPLDSIATNWSNGMATALGGVGHLAFEPQTTIKSLPFGILKFMSAPAIGGTIDNNESVVRLRYQVEIYTEGKQSLSSAYTLDATSHAVMVGMGFRRAMGPEFLPNVDSSIKRLVSQYERVYGSGETV